jgi:cobalamin-dependent methionine synthase I
MKENIRVIKYETPAPDIREIRRYMGDRSGIEAIGKVIEECLEESAECFECRVCYGVYPVNISGKTIDLGFASAESEDLAKNLDGAEKAVVFAATAGLGIDRLIKTYSAQSPLKSLCFDAIGTDRAESICNVFNKEIGSLYTLCRPRFSPGYGDLDISFQKKIFDELSCPSNIGVYLSGSLQMIPTKSVTAIIGVKDENS